MKDETCTVPIKDCVGLKFQMSIFIRKYNY